MLFMAAILKCQFEASRALLVYYGVCFFIPHSNMEILESVDHAFKWDIITVKHSVVLALSTHFLNWWSKLKYCSTVLQPRKAHDWFVYIKTVLTSFLLERGCGGAEQL